MSRAFVKEPDSDSAEELPDLPLSPNPNFVTPQGLEQLKSRQAALELQRAEAETASDLAARQRLPEIRRDLRYLAARISRAILVTPRSSPPDEVYFGVTVEVRDAQGNDLRFTVVGEDEADAAGGKVSWMSPLAKALLGKEVGAKVVWKRPVGDLELEIIAIHL